MITVSFETEIYLDFIIYTYKKSSFCRIHPVVVHLINFW